MYKKFVYFIVVRAGILYICNVIMIHNILFEFDETLSRFRINSRHFRIVSTSVI